MFLNDNPSNNNNDIYEYYFNELQKHIKMLVGGKAIHTPTDPTDIEIDMYISSSKLLFDIVGNEFQYQRTGESEYRYWVEVYVTKMILALLDRYLIQYEDIYHPGKNEQHSIIISKNNKRIEMYFLYDIVTERANCTEYDQIARVLKTESHNTQGIKIYVFRNEIHELTVAGLMTLSPEMNEHGFVEACPLKDFFDTYFSMDEYNTFLQYANAFVSKCNFSISYKTVITPTSNTIETFRKKKSDMMRDMDYQSISEQIPAEQIPVKQLPPWEFQKIVRNYIDNKMYLAMTSANDFADSFISAEWSFDVYQYAMGELELTGIISGYLKSIEQLLFSIIKFHRDEGKKIRTYSNGIVPFTKDNENDIDSTLGSLADFVSYAKLPISKKIREYITQSIRYWKDCQRNGYFHKHNLYRKDNKLSEIRLHTLYLYFLILGGIDFSQEERFALGAIDCNVATENNDRETQYQQFRTWLNGIVEYDIHGVIPGLWLVLSHDFEIRNEWHIMPHEMPYFYLDDFVNGEFKLDSDTSVLSHLHILPEFTLLLEKDSNDADAVEIIRDLWNRYSSDSPYAIQKISNIVITYSNAVNHLLYSKDAESFFSQYQIGPDGDIIDADE